MNFCQCVDLHYLNLACNTLYHKRKLVFTVQGVSDQSRRLPQQQGQLANKTENPLKDTLEKTESDANWKLCKMTRLNKMTLLTRLTLVARLSGVTQRIGVTRPSRVTRPARVTILTRMTRFNRGDRGITRIITDLGDQNEQGNQNDD